MGFGDLLYGAYERRLAHQLEPGQLPHHVGAIVDGNRRWAKDAGTDLAEGYAAGAAKVDEFLGWCHDLGVGTVTFWVLSTDNLQRPPDELQSILAAVETLVERLADDGRWRLTLMGSLELLPAEAVIQLKEASERTADNPPLGGASVPAGGAPRTMQVNVCVGYGGRQELTDAIRSLLLEKAAEGHELADVARTLEVDDIAEHLYTKGQPDPDLVIRTSGEQRLSGFLLWQSVHSEFYFSDVLWPAFRKVDLLRAFRSYAARQRRFGR